MFDDILSLQIFEKVAVLRSFSRGAKALNFSQVMVSKRIAKLEAKVGLKLLDRSTRVISLTPDGQQFLDSCRRILGAIEHEFQALKNRDELIGLLRFAVPPFFARHHIVPYLNDFLTLHPKLKLEMYFTENPVDLIEEGLHFEVRIGHLQDSLYEQEILFLNHKVICASPDYLVCHGTPKHPQDLYEHNCLIFAENRFWTLLDSKNQRYVLELSGNIKCDNGEVIKEMVLAGLGITLKSQQDIQEELRDGRLVALFPDYTIENSAVVYAQYPKSVLLKKSIETFLSFIVARYA